MDRNQELQTALSPYKVFINDPSRTFSHCFIQVDNKPQRRACTYPLMFFSQDLKIVAGKVLYQHLLNTNYTS